MAGEHGSREPLTQAWWDRDRSVPLLDHTAGTLLAERAAGDGGRLALVGVEHGTGRPARLTYAELLARAQRAAAALLRCAEPGAFVALWAPNVVEWPIVECGAALAGMTLVALNPVLQPDELAYALRHSGAEVLIHASRSRDRDLAAVVTDVAPDVEGLRHVVDLDGWSVWLAGADADDAPVTELPDVDPVSPAMLQYTSGTTGVPKGVLLRHHSLVNLARITMEVVEAPAGCVAVNPLPLFHTAGCVVGTLGPLWLGGTQVLVERFEAAAVVDLLRDEGADVLFYVPTVLAALVEAARAGDRPAPRLTTVMGGASAVSPTLIEAAEEVFGASVHNLFGQTELSPVLTMTRRSDRRDRQLHTVGRPIPQVDCKVVHPETGATCAVDEEGEVCARGYQQLIGYLHDPAATARAVDTDGWVHTGDLGRMDADGYLTVTGRLKELIIRGGDNIAPTEIEAVLAEHPAVLEAAAVGIPDERWGEVVGVFVRAREDPADVREALAEHAARRLSPYKRPQHWFFVDDLPITPTGKVQRFRLVEVALDELGRPGTEAPGA